MLHIEAAIRLWLETAVALGVALHEQQHPYSSTGVPDCACKLVALEKR